MFVGSILNSTTTHSGCGTGFLMNPSVLAASPLEKRKRGLRVPALLRTHLMSASWIVSSTFGHAGVSWASNTNEYMT